jgi:Flp pilus assembly protein TadG
MRDCDEDLRQDQRGVVYVEFLLAFMPLFIFFLGMIQLALVYSAKLVVDHAAYRAVRSAIVVLDDDPAYYNGEPRLTLGNQGITASELAAARVGISTSATGQPTNTTLSRRATIELAAGLVLMPLASGSSNHDEQASRTRQNMDVSLRVGSVDVTTSPVEPDDEIIVRVEYEYECQIPIGSLVCSGGTKTLSAEAPLVNHGARYPYFSEL